MASGEVRTAPVRTAFAPTVPASLPALERRPGWDRALAAFIERHRRTPFDWKEHNCATFVVEGALAICTARSIETPPIYDLDATFAARQAQNLGGLEAAASVVFGPPLAGWKPARRGDVVLALCDGRATLFLCAGATICAPGLEGLVILPLSRALKTWRIG